MCPCKEHSTLKTFISKEASALSHHNFTRGQIKMTERVCSYYNTLSTRLRVCCLYRVSTAKQVDHNEQNQADIPMQRKACHEFAEKMGWTIVREEQEAGVSGFKVSTYDRDKIQLIRDEALKGSFDVLLVFMFDRLGRQESETPFVMEWFVTTESKSGASRKGSSGSMPTLTT